MKKITGTDKNFEELLKDNELKLVYVYAPTKFFEEYLDDLSSALEDVEGALITLNIEENKTLEEQLGVNSLPKLIIGYQDHLSGLANERVNPQRVKEVIPHFIEDMKKREENAKIMEKHTVKVTSENYDKVTKESKAVIVDFWAEWCGPCHSQAQIFVADGEAFLKEFPNLVIAKLNVDEEGDLAAKYDASSIPMMQLFVKGKLIDTIVGVHSSEDIIKIMKKGK